MAETTLAHPKAGAGRLAVISWALYDFANTIFSMNIVSLYFSLWVVNDMGGRDIHYSTANNISMLLLILTAPLLGSLSDQARRRMPFLIASTIVCVLFTGLVGPRRPSPFPRLLRHRQLCLPGRTHLLR